MAIEALKHFAIFIAQMVADHNEYCTGKSADMFQNTGKIRVHIADTVWH